MSTKQQKRIYSFEELCNGCRLCEMQCSFINEKEFNPKKSLIRIAKVESEGINTPIVNCNGDCPHKEDGIPECVRVCPTGALIYVTASEALKKRQELVKKRAVQPIFKIIAPWKWPFPSWSEWPFKDKIIERKCVL